MGRGLHYLGYGILEKLLLKGDGDCVTPLVWQAGTTTGADLLFVANPAVIFDKSSAKWTKVKTNHAISDKHDVSNTTRGTYWATERRTNANGTDEDVGLPMTKAFLLLADAVHTTVLDPIGYKAIEKATIASKAPIGGINAAIPDGGLRFRTTTASMAKAARMDLSLIHI